MKIETLNIPASLMGNGLEDISLNKLSDLVLLSGRNGSGKTRFLNTLSYLSEVNSKLVEFCGQRNESPDGVTVNTQASIKSNIIHYTNALKANPESQANINELFRLQYMLLILENNKTSNRVLTIEDNPENLIPRIIKFVPQSLKWVDNRSKRENENTNSIKVANNPGSDATHNWICSYVRDVSDKFFAAKSPIVTTGNPELTEKSIKDYETLNEITNSLLGQEFGFNVSGRPILFDHHIFDAKLSDGQKVLLQLAVQIHAQAEKMADVIILLDEPENHLHPQACIDFIVKVRSIIPDNQLWISTHSIPILSYFFENSTLLFVNDGKVKYRGSAPEEVFKSLLGDDERIQKLRDFLGLPSEYAMLKYSRECLLPPDTHLSEGEDPQGNQIYKKINELKIDKKRILDFGAGKGRILVELNERSASLTDSIDYVAYDKFLDDKDICESTISSVYNDDNNRYFNNLSEISGDFENGSFDVIVMCNVLHEIEPSNWLELFGDSSSLVNLLKDEGSLLLVEDEEIPIGEKAYKQGFIVLGKAELRVLFNIAEAETGFICDDQRGDGRLMAHLIPKACLCQITPESMKAALRAKQNRAKEEIERLREGQANYKNGRKHGFWIQQYTNTSLVLDSLG